MGLRAVANRSSRESHDTQGLSPSSSVGSLRNGIRRPTVIIGLGKSGLACARFLARGNEPVVIVDNRAAPPELDTLKRELPNSTLHLGSFDPDVLCGAGELVVSPGVSLDEPAIRRAMRRGVPVLGEIELFARAATAPVVAITGSNGKSTVTALVGEMGRADAVDVRVGGNLGPPALDLLRGEAPGMFVLELSSFQLETTSSLRPFVAAILNVSLDHIDRHGSMDAYIQAKARILSGDGAIVLNLDDPNLSQMMYPGRRIIGFTTGRPPNTGFGLVKDAETTWLASADALVMRTDELGIAGLHNIANALAAVAIGSAVGLSMEAMRAALSRFSGLPHRCQLVTVASGVRWYNDSKATNVGATVAAIKGLGERGNLLLIAGGDGKGADFSPLRDAARGRVRVAVLIGRDATLIENALDDATEVVRAEGMDGAVALARARAQCGDAVLLSPACASFDMYGGYEERGDVFEQLARGGAC